MWKSVFQLSRMYFIISAIVIFVLVSFQSVTYQVNDFCQNYVAAKRFITGQPIYTPISCWTIPFPTDIQYSAHPPSSVVFYIPFTFFSEQTANYIFDIFSICAYVFAGILLLRLLNAPVVRGILFFLAFSYYWYPFHIANSIHNVSSVLLLLLALSAYAYQRENRNTAALILGFAALIKLWPIILLLGFYITGNKKEARNGFLLFVTGWAITVFTLGIPNIAAYGTNVIPNEKFFLGDPNNWTIAATIIRPISGYPFSGMTPFIADIPLGEISLIATGISGIFLCIFLLLLNHLKQQYSQHSFILLYGYLTIVAFITFPLSWNWNVPLLLVPLSLAVILLRQIHYKRNMLTALFVCGVLPLLFGQWQTPLSLLGIVDSLSPWKTILASWPPVCLFLLLTYIVLCLRNINGNSGDNRKYLVK